MPVPYLTILESVKTVIDALAIPDFTTVIRKRMIVADPDEPPIAIIVPGVSTIESEATEGVVNWIRPVWIGIASPTGDGRIESEFDIFDYEDQIRRALHTPTLSGAPTVFHVDIAPDNQFIPAAVDSGYDLTIFRIDYWSTESRT